MADASRNASHDGYFHMPMDTEGGSGPDVVSAHNVTVADASTESGASIPHISADQVRVETPRGAEGAAREVPVAQKVKGAAQMAGGAALIVAGVPLCVLPGPGAASIAGGAALASKGHRNFTGREATPIEAKLDEAAEKLGAAAKEQAAKAARSAAEKAPEVAGNAARTVAQKAPEMAGKVVVATAKATPKVAGAAAKAVKAGAGFVAGRRKGR